ncbi:MAG: hypothetical protein ACD_9C00268G0005 [uncultured bacterium]|nr:MAG: hypothetical protein ACD_9C00268G0005 [uncultured bacterium]
MTKDNIKSFGQLLQKREVKDIKKAPTFQWQELALKIIEDLDVPKEKRNSIFRVCKQHNRQIIERAISDTKELCKSGEKWRYFFKVIDIIKKKPVS